MPRPAKDGKGKRVLVYIPHHHLKLWKDIDNKSNFVQTCLDDAIGIMTWAILRKSKPDVYRQPNKTIEEVLPAFNEKFPLDPLTAHRLGKQTWPKNSPSEHELW